MSGDELPGGDLPVQFRETGGELSGAERRAERCQALRRSPQPDRFIAGQRGRLRDGDHFTGEVPRLPRRRGPVVRLGAVFVKLAAAELPPVRHELGGHALVHQPGRVTGRDAVAGRRRPRAAQRDGTHRFDAGRDNHVLGPGHDGLGGKHRRLLAGAALPVDGRAGHRLGEPRGQRGAPRDIAGLLADLLHAADEHVVKQGRVDPGPDGQRPQHAREQVNGMHAGQPAACLAPPDWRAHSVDDDRLFHKSAPQSHAAGYAEGLGGDVGSLGRGEKRDRGGDLVRGAKPA